MSKNEDKYPLVVEVAGSYSGVSDIIRNEGKAEELLKQIDDYYNESKTRQEQLEKELEQLKVNRGTAVGLFLHCYRILGKSDKPLVFFNRDNVVMIHKKNEDVINYESFELTDLSHE